MALPALFSAGSAICILALALFTSPVNNVSYAIFFFLALLVFLVSFGWVVSLAQNGQVSRKSRGRIVIFSLFIILFLMFRSAGSLNWVDGLILVLIVAGLIFYGSRRP